jgi:hypothetical protein
VGVGVNVDLFYTVYAPLASDPSPPHVLCDCEALAYLRFRHLGQFFMEPGDFYDVPIGKVLHFIRSVGLTKG